MEYIPTGLGQIWLTVLGIESEIKHVKRHIFQDVRFKNKSVDAWGEPIFFQKDITLDFLKSFATKEVWVRSDLGR